MNTLLLLFSLLIASNADAQNTSVAIDDNGSEYVQQGKLVKVTHYHENGAVKERGFFLNGQPEGKWETFAKNGMKTAELNYSEGKRHGEFRTWDTYSDSYLEVRYAEGEMISANRYVKEAGFAADHE